MNRALLLFMLAVHLSAQVTVETQVKQTRELIAAHRASVPRLSAIATSSAQVLLNGGAWYLCCGDNPWINEGASRAGGPMGLKVARSAGQIPDNSLVWVSYDANSYQSIRAEIIRMPRSARVVAFGPKPEAGPPKLFQWIDSLVAWDADDDLILMGNVLSFWSMTGEVAAAAARSGKTMAFFQSAWVPGANARNDRYANLTFHKGGPQMQPADPGVLASSYLDSIGSMVAEIAESELPAITKVGHTMSQHEADHNPVILVATSHLMSSLGALGNPAYQFESDPAKFASKLSAKDYLVSLGYSAIDADLFGAVHRAGAGAMWAAASSAKPPEAPADGDTFLNERWEPGDAVVKVPGYDVPILPPSGIAQLFIYELLLRAAGSKQ
jgi:hypothetical protein